MLDGVVQGADAVRSVVVTIRSLYDRQEHKFAGPYRLAEQRCGADLARP